MQVSSGSEVILAKGTTDMKRIPAFPGAEGAGKYTTGGRGGDVYEVTTLADYAAGEKPISGSLRDAVSGSNRMIVFRVGGEIRLKEPLRIIGNNLTIAGQTAPGDGIVLTDYSIIFGNDKAIAKEEDIYAKSTTGNNIILRYLRVRPGDRTDAELDAIWARWHHDIIIDHCSFSWSNDEALAIYGNINTTVQWCLASESLTMSKHVKGRHGYGAIFGGKAATVHHNLLATHTSRAPRIDGQGRLDSTATDFMNNVIYNWGFNSLYGGQGNTRTNIIGNYYKPGPGTQDYADGGVRKDGEEDPLANIGYRIANPSRPGGDAKSYWFIRDNVVEGYPEVSRDNRKGVYIEDPVNTLYLEEPAATSYRPVVERAEDAYTAVMANVGATLPKRDWLDQRIVDDVRRGTGRFINTPAEAGGIPKFEGGKPPLDGDHDGIPDVWEIEHGLDPNDPADGKQVAANGYTNLENYLNHLVAQAEENPRINPQINLVGPADNQVYKIGEVVVFKTAGVRANTAGAKIIRVDFYVNDVKMGESLKTPYEFNWKNPSEGTHYLSAIAYDDQGLATQSNIIAVHVNEPDQTGIWEAADIGEAPIPGNTVFKGHSAVIKGSGSLGRLNDPADSASGSQDALGFVYQRIGRQATLVARVDDFTLVDNSATTGLMVRKTLDATAPMAVISLQLEKAGRDETGRAVVVKARTAQGAALVRTDWGLEALSLYNHADKGYWLKLVRDDNHIKTFYAADGKTWTLAWKGELDLGDEAYLGLAVDGAANLSKLRHYNRAVFSEIALDHHP